MTDIVERLLTAVGDEKQAGGALNRDAAEEIRQLREENRKLKSQIEQLQRIGEPEF